jgi:hypothetical protein
MKHLDYFFKKPYATPFFLFLITFCVFVAGMRYVASGDAIPAVILPASIIYEHNLDFNEFVKDKNSLEYYFRNVNGRIVSNFPILPGLLNTPVFLLAYFLGMNPQQMIEERLFLSLLSAAAIASLSVVFMYLALKKITVPKTAIFFSLVYAFATSAWSVAAIGIWQHGPSIMFITAALWLLLRKDQYLPYSGLLLSLAFFNRPSNLLIVLAIMIYVFLHHRQHFRNYFIAVLLPLPFFVAYSYIYYGQFLFIYSLSAVSLTGNFGKGILSLLLSPNRGLFIFSPIFIFSFTSLIPAIFLKTHDTIYRYLAIAAIALLIFYSKVSCWFGGWGYSYRFLVEILPILIIFLVLAWEENISKKLYLRFIFSFLLLWSVYTQTLGAYIYPSGFEKYALNDPKCPSGECQTKRLWNFKDNEITRCSKKFIQAVFCKTRNNHE